MSSLASPPKTSHPPTGNIIIAIVHGEEQNRNAARSLQVLEDAVRTCDFMVRSGPVGSAIAAGNRFDAIVLAPEYFFVALASPRRPMTEQRKDEVEASLFALSRTFPKVLIIPGTLFYEKLRNRPNEHQRRLITDGQDAGKRLGSRKNSERSTSFLRKIDHAMQTAETSGMESLENLVKRGVEDGPAKFAPAMVRKREFLEGKARGICRNRTFVFLGGERLAKYDKCFDYFESHQPEELVFLHGSVDQTAEVGGYKFGIEICADHGLKILKTRNVTVDFQVVLSDYIDTMPESMSLRPGGYYLHASTAWQKSSIWRCDPESGQLVNLTEEYHRKRESGGGSGTRQWYYVVELPIHSASAAAGGSSASAAAAVAANPSAKLKERIRN